MKKNVIHIGFGKTGSTSLQRHFFPTICDNAGYTFNCASFTRWHNHRYFEDEELLGDLKLSLASGNQLISAEQLLDWNPNNWEKCIPKLASIFDGNAKIIITIKDPIEYLTSLYIQMIQEGNVVPASEYFVNQETLSRLSPFIGYKSILRYNPNSLDYVKLHQLCLDNFNDFTFINITQLQNADVWSSVFDCETDLIHQAIDKLRMGKRENISYSERAIKFTVGREKFFNFFGAQTIGSQSLVKNQNKLSRHVPIEFRNLTKEQKKQEFTRRLKLRIFKNWQWWMKNVVDGPFKNKRFVLEDKIMNPALLRANRDFLMKISENINIKKKNI